MIEQVESMSTVGARSAGSGKSSAYLFFGGCLTLPMLILRLGPITISDLLFMSSAVTSFLQSSRRGAEKPAYHLLIGLGLIAVLASSTASRNFGPSIEIAARVLYIWTVWEWGAKYALTSKRRIEQSILALVVGGSLSALAALLQIVFGVVIDGSQSEFGRAAGLSTHPNGQGGLLAVVAVLAWGLYVSGRNRDRIVGGMGFFACLLGLVLSGSVTGMIACSIGILAVIVLSRPTLYSVSVVITSLLSVWIVLLNYSSLFPGAAGPFDRIRDTTGQGSGDSTLELRLLTDEFAWAGIQRRPIFGVGLDPALGGTYDGSTLTHNIFLLAWYQGGLLFLLVLIAVLYYGMKKLLLVREAAPNILVASSALSALTFALTGPVLFERWFWFPWIVAMAALPVPEESPPIRWASQEPGPLVRGRLS